MMKLRDEAGIPLSTQLYLRKNSYIIVQTSPEREKQIQDLEEYTKTKQREPIQIPWNVYKKMEALRQELGIPLRIQVDLRLAGHKTVKTTQKPEATIHQSEIRQMEKLRDEAGIPLSTQLYLRNKNYRIKQVLPELEKRPETR